jgi:hypothetical protein
MPKSVPACTKRFCEGMFGEHVSVGGYASAGFAEAVKMPCAEAQGASLKTRWRDKEMGCWGEIIRFDLGQGNF